MNKIYIAVELEEMDGSRDDYLKIIGVFSDKDEAEECIDDELEDKTWGLEGYITFDTHYQCYYFEGDTSDTDYNVRYYKIFEYEVE